jgi:hypothetical protein
MATAIIVLMTLLPTTAAHDDGHPADAHSLTLGAAEFLEDAICIEELHAATSRLSATQKNDRLWTGKRFLIGSPLPNATS